MLLLRGSIYDMFSSKLVKGQQSKIPLHIHLTNKTPLHVHVDRPAKPTSFDGFNHTNSKHENDIKSSKNLGQKDSKNFNEQEQSLNTNQNSNRKGNLNSKISSSSYQIKLPNNINNDECSVNSNFGKIRMKNIQEDLERLRNAQQFIQDMCLKMRQFGILMASLKEISLLKGTSKVNEILEKKKLLLKDFVFLDDIFLLLGNEMEKLVDVEEGIVELMMEKNKIDYENENIKTSLKKLKDELNERKESVETLQSQIRSLKDEILQKESREENLNEDRVLLQSQVDEKNKELQKMENQVLQLEKNLNELRSKEFKNHDATKESLKKAARLYKTRASEKEAENCRLKQEGEQLNHQLSMTKLQVAKVVGDKRFLQIEFDNLQNRIKNSEKVKNDIKLPNEEMVKKYSLLQEAVDNLQNQNRDLSRHLEGERRKVDELKLLLNKTYHSNHEELNKLQTDLLQVQMNSNNNNCEERRMYEKICEMERKINKLDDENKDLMLSNVKNEELLNSTQLRLDDKVSELSVTQKQLEALEKQMKKINEGKELDNQDRKNFIDLENQVGQMRHEMTRIRREKDENDRKQNQKITDLRDRLEQTNSTNRTLHNYIHFLKNSYAAAFSDNPISLTSSDLISGLGYKLYGSS